MRHIAAIALLSLTLAPPAAAQSLNDIAVTPLGVPSNCYAGTAGTDATMFWRANPILDCQAFNGPASPCLIRKEFAADGPAGNPISLYAGPFLRPSVSGPGDVVIFTEYGFNICLMASASDSTEGCFGRDFLGIDPHTGAFHPDGTLVAVTRLDPNDQFNPTNDIFLADPNTFVTSEIYEVTDFVNLYQIDTVDFLVGGSHLIIDAHNPATGLWGIYAVPRGGPFPAAVAPVPLVAPVAGFVIRNPQLAQTSDDYMVFDAYELATGTNHVLAANLLTGAIEVVDSVVSNFLSYPTYTGDDSGVVYGVPDAATLTTFSLNIRPLAGDRMTPAGPSTEWIDNGYAPVVYRRGTWNGARRAGGCAPPLDTDGDGIGDGADNCTLTVNADQVDADGDGIGNRCDADFNNDCIVNPVDLGIFKSVFFTADAEADLNVDGVVNPVDLGLFKARFFQVPGPSGVPNVCD